MDESNQPITVKISRVLPARKWKVLRLISRVGDFPRYMPNVKECTVLERDGRSAITAWEVEVGQIPMRWKERDEFDYANFEVRFKLIEGDLEAFEGKWALQDHPAGGTRVDVEVSAKIGVPVIARIIGDVVAGEIKKNFETMLDAMARTLTAQRYRSVFNSNISGIKGFCVIGHPYNFQHLVRIFKFFKPDLKVPSKEFLVKLFEITPSYKSYDIRNFKSKTGQEINGSFVMCPIIPDMVSVGCERVLEKVIQACQIAEQLGAGIVCLGGFTSIAGEKYGKALAEAVHVPITTGNTFTTALALDGIYKAADLMGIDLAKAKATIIGGTGDIGSAVARNLAERVHEITITSRSEKNLMDVERTLFYYGKARIKTTRDNNLAVRGADIVLAAAGVSATTVDFRYFKPGAVVCDIGYPKNISYTQCNRSDILIFSGGIAKVPSEFSLGFDIGLPNSGVLYGCWAEAIVLALEGRYENFSWGKGNISRERIQYIREAAGRHGFDLAPFFWGDRMLSDGDILEIAKGKTRRVAV